MFLRVNAELIVSDLSFGADSNISNCVFEVHGIFLLFAFIISQVYANVNRFLRIAFLFFASGYDPHPPQKPRPVSPSVGMPPRNAHAASNAELKAGQNAA